MIQTCIAFYIIIIFYIPFDCVNTMSSLASVRRTQTWYDHREVAASFIC
jgi:hypothetical protein